MFPERSTTVSILAAYLDVPSLPLRILQTGLDSRKDVEVQVPLEAGHAEGWEVEVGLRDQRREAIVIHLIVYTDECIPQDLIRM